MYTADVLVIGCGLAGLMASIEAARNGVNVILACKSPAGFGTCTYYSAGVFRGAFGKYSVERHFIETIYHGWFLNDQELVRHLVVEAPKKIMMLQNYGIDIKIGDGRAYVEDKFPSAGSSLIKPLINYAQKIGVKILDRHIALDLIKIDDAVCGCIFYNIKENDISVIYSKSVVLATGGYSGIYLRTDNPTSIVGDGCVIALRAGADLSDMEFVQYFPLCLSEKNKSTWLFPIISGKLVNKLGEDVVKKYNIKSLHDAAVKQRDLLSRIIMQEIRKGNGIDDALILEYDVLSMNDDIKKSALDKLGVSLVKLLGFPMSGRVKVAPSAHFTMGGIKINPDCSTNISGLYACGEVTSGVHGANRLGGNALTEAVVFGVLAGKSAAEYSKTKDIYMYDSYEKIEYWKNKLKLFRYGTINVNIIRDKLRKLMWHKCGVIRVSKELRELIKELRELKDRSYDLKALKTNEIVKAIETINMITIGEVIALSALERKESRGAHYRDDHPYKDDKNWIKRITVKLENNNIKLYYVNVKFRYLTIN